MKKLLRFWDRHPVWSSGVLLAVGMVIILAWAAKDVGFTPSQWAALIAATVALAFLSAWIINWE